MTAIEAPHATDKPTRNGLGFRRLAILAAASLALIAALAFGIHWWVVGRFLQSTNDAYFKADAMTVAPRISGYVSDVLVVSNQDVQAGQLLAKIDDDTYRAGLARAQAQADQAVADIKQLEAQIDRQQAILEQAGAQASVADSAEAFAKRDSQRYGDLEQSGAVSGRQADEARTSLLQRHADVTNMHAAVISARKEIEVLEAQVGQAKSALEAARAAVLAAQLDLDATQLRSRIKGRIGDKTINVGQYVQAGTRLMSVMPLQDIYVEANYKETQIGRIRIGQPVTIQVDALPDTPITGHVESLSPGTGAQFALMPPENATGNFTKIVQRVPVRIRVEADPKVRATLLPGLSVTTTVDTRDQDGQSP